MPAFVNHGPDIPERLLQAHEDGRVVFFCGAGLPRLAYLSALQVGWLVSRIFAVHWRNTAQFSLLEPTRIILLNQHNNR